MSIYATTFLSSSEIVSYHIIFESVAMFQVPPFASIVVFFILILLYFILCLMFPCHLSQFVYRLFRKKLNLYEEVVMLAVSYLAYSSSYSLLWPWGQRPAEKAEKASQQSFFCSPLPFTIFEILRIFLSCYVYFTCYWQFLISILLSRTHSDNSSIYVFIMSILLQCFYPV